MKHAQIFPVVFALTFLFAGGCQTDDGNAESARPTDESQGTGEVAADRHSEEGRVRADRQPFSLVPPEGWTEENTPPNILTFKGPVDNGFAANFTVGADPYSGNPPLENLSANLKADLPPQFTVVDEGFTTIDGKKAYVVHTNVTAQGVELVNIQHFFPSGRTMYSVSFASTAASYDQHKATLQSILDSVHAD